MEIANTTMSSIRFADTNRISLVWVCGFVHGEREKEIKPNKKLIRTQNLQGSCLKCQTVVIEYFFYSVKHLLSGLIIKLGYLKGRIMYT